MNVRYLAWNKPFHTEEGKDENPMIFVMDYYHRAFALFHEELKRDGFRPGIPHPIRRRFWGLLPYRQYSPIEGRELVLKYINSVERQLADIVSEYSLAYWLHLYRRLSPGAIGYNTQPATVGQVRAALEAAIQKYAKFEPCNRVGITGDIPTKHVLGGILMAPEFDFERQILEEGRQLVLTSFTCAELREFYDVERLAYELWYSSAMLRIVGKGASIIVDDSEVQVFDVRSDELDKLVTIFDTRNKTRDYWLLSATGVVHDMYALDPQEAGFVFLPTYNLTGIPIDEFDGFFATFNIAFKSFGYPMVSNFVWLPFSLRQFRETHVSFAEAFREKYGVELDAVLLVIAALCERVFYIWMEYEVSLMRFWQRAYEGPYTRDYVLDEIQNLIPVAAQRLNLDEDHVDQLELRRALQFWELDDSKRLEMDLAYSGPHSVFLPHGNDRVFIDYTWVLRRLYSLFVGVNIPDQNFKGAALEHLVRSKKSVLPVRACRSRDGGKKQIDAAFEVGDRLVIVECRAIGRSIGFSRGNPDAIRYRNQVVDNALKEVDQKAHWLAEHPLGTNYDITHYSDILPVAVTPFAEYIPSLQPRYWLTENLPRVLTPGELRTALENGTLADVAINAVPINNMA